MKNITTAKFAGTHLCLFDQALCLAPTLRHTDLNLTHSVESFEGADELRNIEGIRDEKVERKRRSARSEVLAIVKCEDAGAQARQP